MKRLTAPRGPWIELVEAIHNPARDDASWAAPIIDSAKGLLSGADVVGLYMLGYEPDLSAIRLQLSLPDSAAMAVLSNAAAVANEGGRAVIQPFHFAGPVRTYMEAARSVPRALRSAMDSFHAAAGLRDGLGIVAHPAPGVVTVLHAIYSTPLRLSAYERHLLARLALHLENGYRARLRPEAVRAVIGADGKVHHREAEAPTNDVLATAASRIGTARTRRNRTSEESLDLWTALVAGRVSIAPRFVDGRTSYVVLDNPPPARALRALSATEAAVVSFAARGLSTKLASYALGLRPSVISRHMETATAKVGAMSRAELIRLAALLSRDPRADLETGALSAAEHDVLELLQQGLSNERIAIARSRSVRTIANQVASILRKTKKPSRRALIASRSARRN